jgi:phosphoribosylformylglycinamidine synthase PurS subunit
MATVRVYVTLKPSLLDSAGKTVAGSLQKLGYAEVNDVRVGKMIEMQLENPTEARIKEMCEKLLANPVIENYRYEVDAK